MGLTYEEALKYAPGHAHLHPQAPGRKADAPAAKRKASGLNALGQNKTEAAFDRYLGELRAAGSIGRFWWEPFALRLAGRTAYRPDFVAERLAGLPAVLEIKGFMRDDAAVKVKTAAEAFAGLFEFFVVFRAKRSWDVRRVGRNGIGQRNAGQGWIGGGA